MTAPCALVELAYRADPAAFFERLRHAPGAVLLDSGRPAAERGRHDILSAWPAAMLTPMHEESGPAFFERLRGALRRLGPAVVPGGEPLPFAGGVIGYLAYEFGRRLEPLTGNTEDIPDARFGLYDWALITDHHRRTSTLVFHPACPTPRRQAVIETFRAFAAGAHDDAHTSALPAAAAAENFRLESPFRPAVDQAAYRDAVVRIREYIAAGDCYQVNYTQQFAAAFRGDPWPAYRALRAACPTPFAGYLDLGGGGAVLSLSPERFLRLSGGRIEARPIKGTRPRGRTPEEDRALADRLLASTKDRAENVMIVDLLRNDIGRSCRTGSVRVPELCSLESYPNVHHLVSCVCGELMEGRDAFDLLAGSFPGGSITGAPKLRAMQIIEELEPHRRGVYCGSLLYIDVRGEMDSSITIRTLVAHNGRIRCWGGGGIVHDSIWQKEYQESLDKVSVLMKTLEGMGGAPG